MSRNKNLLKERNINIKALYEKYAAEYVVGPKGIKEPKYRHRAMLVMVGKKFYLEPDTINNILSQPDEEIDENQLELFK